MEAFASVEDFTSRYPDEGLDEERLKLLLEDATAYIAGNLVKAGIDYSAPDEIFKRNLATVCCRVVKRSIDTESDGPYTQLTETAGPYTQSRSLANPHGDFYLTSGEKQLLNLTRGSVSYVRPTIGVADDTW